MVTTRNQGSQQNHFVEDPTAILAEMKQELEAIKKLREEDRICHAGALDVLREENERLRQRNDKVEWERVHTGNTPGEGSRHETRREEGSQWEIREEGSRHEGRREESSRPRHRKEAREETSRMMVANTSSQYPFTDEIMTSRLPKGWKNPTLERYDGQLIRTNTLTRMSRNCPSTQRTHMCTARFSWPP